MVTLNTDYARFRTVTARLLDINQKSCSLDIEYQKLIGENLMLRLFYELDGCIEAIVLKLIRGVPYLDTTVAILNRAPFNSQDAARQYIISKNRRPYLEWTTMNKINKNLNGIMDPTDHFILTRNLHDGALEDMRKVRNHIAHNTSSTRAQYASVVQKIYASTNGISPAKFLLSQKIAISGYAGRDQVIVQYVKWSNTFLKTLTKSPI